MEEHSIQIGVVIKNKLSWTLVWLKRTDLKRPEDNCLSVQHTLHDSSSW